MRDSSISPAKTAAVNNPDDLRQNQLGKGRTIPQDNRERLRLLVALHASVALVAMNFLLANGPWLPRGMTVLFALACADAVLLGVWAAVSTVPWWWRLTFSVVCIALGGLAVYNSYGIWHPTDHGLTGSGSTHDLPLTMLATLFVMAFVPAVLLRPFGWRLNFEENGPDSSAWQYSLRSLFSATLAVALLAAFLKSLAFIRWGWAPYWFLFDDFYGGYTLRIHLVALASFGCLAAVLLLSRSPSRTWSACTLAAAAVAIVTSFLTAEWWFWNPFGVFETSWLFLSLYWTFLVGSVMVLRSCGGKLRGKCVGCG